ncbi:MAG: hypothetical protein JW395_2320 [Nitrospira sp.]|nr:hypothetical protein [Nitrospira sp.]
MIAGPTEEYRNESVSQRNAVFGSNKAGTVGVDFAEAMARNKLADQPATFLQVASHNRLKTFFLGRVFRDTTNSYKLVWFLALLSLLKRDGPVLRLTDLLTEMAVTAWHPVCCFRLSFGPRDKLQEVIRGLQPLSGLPPTASPDTIRDFFAGSTLARGKVDYFKRYVPTRFLTPWFEEDLRGMEDWSRDAAIKTLARLSQGGPVSSLYWFPTDGGEAIRVSDSWREFLMENFAVVQSFAEHNFALYLQARNPNVPAVLNKLHAPSARQLTGARRFWRHVQTQFKRNGKSYEFLDIYSQRVLSDGFTIDHFLPWSYVVHDLLWNLTPVEPTTNSSKSDRLPDLDLYLPNFSRLHLLAISAARGHPKYLDDYADCFKQDAAGLLALNENELETKYREIMLPQTQIARNQGFPDGYRFRY